jgi:tRNA (guanine-N7-)-methyltransferase
MTDSAPALRQIRSYVVRGGRLTDGQQRALDALWPRYGVTFQPGRLDFAALFGRVAPCTLEIGFGNGDNLLALAMANPQRNFLGVEVHPPGVGHLLQGANARGLSNLKVIQHDAVEVLRLQLAEESLDSIQVLFPDPWHKTRHHKRRLVNPEFARLAASRLQRGGTLQLATDWEPYAEVMLEVLNAAAELRNRAADRRFVPRNPERILTRFESRGERLGHAVHDLCFERL